MLRGRVTGGEPTAVLIVTPPDQDHTRAGFVLGQLARKLAARGVPSLTFDLYSCWDSLGDARAATVERWRADIRTAAGELIRRTGATRLVAVGVRLAAPLLATAGLDSLASGGARSNAQRCGDVIEAARLVLWDPVRDGGSWYAQAAAQHRACVRGLGALRRGRATHRVAGVEELCGTVYARATLHELAMLRLAAPPSVDVATHTTSIAWHDATKIDELLPDPGISRALEDLVLCKRSPS